MEVWKSFEKNGVTHSVAHHLMTINDLIQKRGYARVIDVAASLDITRGSASMTLKTLKARGLVMEDANKLLRLSAEGERISQSIQNTRKIFEKFLLETLQVEPEQAEIDACKIEHLLSRKSSAKLFSLIKFLSIEQPVVNQFLSAYRKFECECAACPEDCAVCETECMNIIMEEERIATASE